MKSTLCVGSVPGGEDGPLPAPWAEPAPQPGGASWSPGAGHLQLSGRRLRAVQLQLFPETGALELAQAPGGLCGLLGV